MTAPRDYRLYLEDILKAIESIEKYVEGLDARSFESDRKTQDAVVRNLEIIGEAVKRVPDEFRTKHPRSSQYPLLRLLNLNLRKNICQKLLWK